MNAPNFEEIFRLFGVLAETLAGKDAKSKFCIVFIRMCVCVCIILQFDSLDVFL